MLITSTTKMFSHRATTPDVIDAERVIRDRMKASETLERIVTLNKSSRPSGSEGYAQAVDYVVEALRAAGWEARVEEVSGFFGRKYRNVVAERRGSGSDAERGVVIAGAHLDTVRSAPGANDNASGSATLIEMAEALKGIDTKNDLKFVWFDDEESGLLGSRAYVKANASEAERAVVMINMDMVGSKFGKPGFDLGRRTSNAFGDAVRGAAIRSGVVMQETARHNRSDHASFDAAGIPAIDFGVDVNQVEKQDPNYHSSRDKADQINTEVLEQYGDVIATTLYEFANRSKASFNFS